MLAFDRVVLVHVREHPVNVDPAFCVIGYCQELVYVLVFSLNLQRPKVAGIDHHNRRSPLLAQQFVQFLCVAVVDFGDIRKLMHFDHVFGLYALLMEVPHFLEVVFELSHIRFVFKVHFGSKRSQPRSSVVAL